MALQPLPARRRQPMMRMSQPLGQIALSDPSVNASADNDAAAQRQQDWNTAAAQQYAQQRQAQNTVDVGTINTESNRQILGKALGYDPSNMPQFGQLYAQFLSKSKPIQVGIYKAGGAPFLNDANNTGMKDLSAVSDKLDALHQQHTSDVVQGVIKGDVGYDIDPTTKQPNWWVKRTIPNPADPTGKAGLPPIEVHEPANPIIKAYLARAVNQGIMPDPVTGKLADTTNPPTPNQRPTEDQFQQILNQRANAPDDTDRFQQVLNQRAGIQPQTPTQPDSDLPLDSNISTYFDNLPPSTNSTTLPTQLTPASTAALALRQKIGNALPSMSGISSMQGMGDVVNDMGNAIGQTYLRDPSALADKGYDYVKSFLTGQGSEQQPTPFSDNQGMLTGINSDYIPKAPLSSVDAALAAARAKQQQLMQPDYSNSNSNFDTSSVVLGGM